jgi:adenosine deaminase
MCLSDAMVARRPERRNAIIGHFAMDRRAFLDVLLAGVAGSAVRPVLATAQPAAWHERLPKVELHLHLDGAIPKATLWELIAKYGGDRTIRTRADLERALVYRDFRSFLKMWVWMIGYLREYDDYTLIGEAVARDLARQNIRYVEGFFSPPDYRQSTLDPQRVTEALRAGVNRVASIEIALVADLVRDRGVDHARNLLERMGEVRKHGVIGIGIGGFEPGSPPELFETTYERARALGFRTTAHAGEAAGPASVWGAVRALRVDRIGHATRAAEDPELVTHLAARRIPLELCPLSNVRTGVITSVESHPLRRYFDAGIPVSLNTDDPLFFGNSLAIELESAQRAHRFTRDEIRRLMLSSIDATWLSAERKKRMAAEFQRDPAWNDSAAVMGPNSDGIIVS